MWLYFDDAFVSVVTHREDANVVLVRSRWKAHINKLFPKAVVKYLPKADYPYRAEILKKDFSAMLARKTEEMLYTNFKYALKEKSPDLYEAALLVYEDTLWGREIHGWLGNPNV